MDDKIELFLKFSDFKGTNHIGKIKKLIPFDTYNFWIKGDKIISNGVDRGSSYKYSTCNYVFLSRFDELEDNISEVLEDFKPYTKELKLLKRKFDLNITFTIVFPSKDSIISFVIKSKNLKILNSIEADIEIV